MRALVEAQLAWRGCANGVVFAKQYVADGEVGCAEDRVQQGIIAEDVIEEGVEEL